ncbi:MAG: fused MFS/spermidine synthase [Kiritimatiellae bacterium]|nr:fused MFS/spermidine synthase [Kiritimatiellia bacterium]MDD5522627.1 fused MFS/spermidine synthase [Kiritimatiellia bacterium]
MTNYHRFLIMICLVASGAGGLICEIVWTKMFGLIFGSTAWAVAVVLGVFMAGLALGSAIVERITDDRIDLLKLYGIIEISIGISAAATPFLFQAGETVYVLLARYHGTGSFSIHLIQSAVAVGVMIIPTVLMGTTLPVLTWYFRRTELRQNRNIGWLYGLNTLGAAAGAFFSAFYLIENFGIRHTLYFAAGLNFLSAACVLLFKNFFQCIQKTETSAEEFFYSGHNGKNNQSIVNDDSPGRGSSCGRNVLLVATFFTGAVALGYEVIWTRLLTSLCLGSSIYAFASMLTVLLFGIMSGSMIYALLVVKIKERTALTLFAVLMSALGIMGILGPRLVTWAGDVDIARYVWKGVDESISNGDWRIIGGLFGSSALVLLCPAMIMGITFPLLACLYGNMKQESNKSIGLFYSMNTIGGITGSLIGTFVLLGKFGVCAGLQVLSAISVFIGIGVWVWNDGMQYGGKLFGRLAFGAVIFCVFTVTGTMLAPRDFFIQHDGGIVKSKEQPGWIFDCEDTDAWVRIWRSYDAGSVNLNMFVNGRALSNTGFHARRYMKLMSHLPLLLHDNCSNSLVICLGSGMTFGSTTLYPLKSSECVELSRAVLHAVDCFHEFNFDIKKQANLEPGTGSLWRGRSRTGTELIMRLEDGRTHLLTTRQAYDLITLEPPHPRDSGSSNLYSSEFYQLCKRRLKSGGMVVQWIPLFQQSREEIRREVHAFIDEFPYVSGWMPSMGNLLLLGSDCTPKLNTNRIRKMMNVKEIQDDLGGIGITNVEQLFGTFVATRDALVEFAGNVPALTDDVPVVEYYRRFGMNPLKMEYGPGSLRFCSICEDFPELKNEGVDFTSRISLCREAVIRGEVEDQTGGQ